MCDDDGLLRSWTLPDGEEEEENAMLAENDGADGPSLRAEEEEGGGSVDGGAGASTR